MENNADNAKTHRMMTEPTSFQTQLCLFDKPPRHPPLGDCKKHGFWKANKDSQNRTDNSPNGVLMLQLFFSMLDSRDSPKVTCPEFQVSNPPTKTKQRG